LPEIRPFRLAPGQSGVHPICEGVETGLFYCMKTLLLRHMFAAAGLFAALAGRAMASPQAADNEKPAIQSAAAINPATLPSPLQPVAPIGGAFPPAPTDPALRLGYFGGPSPKVFGGSFGPAPLGGTFQAGPLGGTMMGQNPPGGRLTNIFVGGAFPPGFNPGGIMIAGRPPGGQLGSNILGGIRSPSNSFTAGPGGVIIGGAQPAGVSPGGVIVPETALGGVIVRGAPPITNTPGGRLTNAPGGQLH